MTSRRPAARPARRANRRRAWWRGRERRAPVSTRLARAAPRAPAGPRPFSPVAALGGRGRGEGAAPAGSQDGGGCVSAARAQLRAAPLRPFRPAPPRARSAAAAAAAAESLGLRRAAHDHPRGGGTEAQSPLPRRPHCVPGPRPPASCRRRRRGGTGAEHDLDSLRGAPAAGHRGPAQRPVRGGGGRGPGAAGPGRPPRPGRGAAAPGASRCPRPLPAPPTTARPAPRRGPPPSPRARRGLRPAGEIPGFPGILGRGRGFPGIPGGAARRCPC